MLNYNNVETNLPITPQTTEIKVILMLGQSYFHIKTIFKEKALMPVK